MKRIGFFGLLGLGQLFLFACTSTIPTLSEDNLTLPESTTLPIETQTETSELQATETLAPNTQVPASFLLAEPGPYFAGNRVVNLVDRNRNERKIELLIWYPAIQQTDSDGRPIIRDAGPDLSGAPYPVILTEENSGRYIFLSHLATYGFVMVVVKSSIPDLDIQKGESALFDLSRDFLFSLDQISLFAPEGLNGLLDTDRVGVVGYSYGGDISLAISGARVDPEFYLSQCAQISSLVPDTFQWVYKDFYCQEAGNWNTVVQHLGDEITHSEDGLWQPMTDERIRAVMPMAPTVSWYYGERGLAAVDRPTFLIWGTKDVDSPYPLEAGYTYDHLTIPERYLISFVGRTHYLPFNEESVPRLKHFAVAYFGYYLQGREEYIEYFSQDFVNQFNDLVWGVYTDD